MILTRTLEVNISKHSGPLSSTQQSELPGLLAVGKILDGAFFMHLRLSFLEPVLVRAGFSAESVLSYQSRVIEKAPESTELRTSHRRKRCNRPSEQVKSIF